MNNTKLPNTFLIGVQKAATTSLYNWLAQHPDVCAPIAVKDLAFFTRDEFYNQGYNHLSKFYEDDYRHQSILLQGSVHYIFFEKALQRIREFNPEAKFILILRNPIERAISAYQYAVKFNYETLPLNEAIAKEEERLLSQDMRVLSELTYKSHGLYYKQIQMFLKYFKQKQLKIVFYEDVSNRPEEVMKDIFSFLKVEDSFIPEFKIHNNTGNIKNKKLQKFIFGDSAFRNFLVKKVITKCVSEDFKSKVRWKIIHFNTKKKTSSYFDLIDPNLKEELLNYYIKDIEKLELLLSEDLSRWKQ